MVCQTMNSTNLIMFFLGGSSSSLIEPDGNCLLILEAYRSRRVILGLLEIWNFLVTCAFALWTHIPLE
jgi:hypothetical protein